MVGVEVGGESVDVGSPEWGDVMVSGGREYFCVIIKLFVLNVTK